MLFRKIHSAFHSDCVMASSSADGIAGGVDAMGPCNELFATTMESNISS